MNIEIPGLELKSLQELKVSLPSFDRKPFSDDDFRDSVSDFISSVAKKVNAKPVTASQPTLIKLFGPGGQLFLTSAWVTAADAEAFYSELSGGDFGKLRKFPSGFFNEQLDQAFLSIDPKYKFIDQNPKLGSCAVDSFNFSQVIAEAFGHINRHRQPDSLDKLIDKWLGGLDGKPRAADSSDYLLAFCPCGSHDWVAFFTSITPDRARQPDALVLGITVAFKAE